jgi:hypothetical protein
MADTAEVTTRVKSVDLKQHKATLEFPDGSAKTVAVRPNVKLSATDVGREVVIQVTQAVAVRVEKPNALRTTYEKTAQSMPDKQPRKLK